MSIAGALHREAANSAERVEPLDTPLADASPAPAPVERQSQDPLRSSRQRRPRERRARDSDGKKDSKKKALRITTREVAVPEAASSVLSPVADTTLSLFRRCLRGLSWLFSGGLGSLPKPWRIGALAVIGLLAAVILRLGTPDTAEERVFDAAQASNEAGESSTGVEAGVDDGPVVVTVVDPAAAESASVEPVSAEPVSAESALVEPVPVEADEVTVDPVADDDVAVGSATAGGSTDGVTEEVARSERPDASPDPLAKAPDVAPEAGSDASAATVSVSSSTGDGGLSESPESPVAEVATGTSAEATGETARATDAEAPSGLTVSVPVEQLELVLRENEELESRVAELAEAAPAADAPVDTSADTPADAPADTAPVVDALVTVLRENVELESLVAELEAETTELEGNLLELDLQVLALEKTAPADEGAAPIELGNSSLIPAPVSELSGNGAPAPVGAAPVGADPGVAPATPVGQAESFLPSGIFDDYENAGGGELPVDEAAAFNPQAGRATYAGTLPPSAGNLDAGNFSGTAESVGAGARVERVAITEVPVGSSAEAAGVVPGDILLAVDGREIVRLSDLDPYLNGDPAPLHELELLRDDRRQWVDLAGSPAELALATRYIDPARLTLD